MSRAFNPCRLEMEFEGEERQFRLPLTLIAELQTACKAGIGVIYRRIFTFEYHAEDLVETVRLGLIGGGMDRADANKIIARRTKGDEQWPLEIWHEYALAILSTCIVGYEDKSKKKPTPGTATPTGSTSPQPTESATKKDSDPTKSTG